MKKVIITAIAIMMVFAFAGCGSSDENTETAKTTIITNAQAVGDFEEVSSNQTEPGGIQEITFKNKNGTYISIDLLDSGTEFEKFVDEFGECTAVKYGDYTFYEEKVSDQMEPMDKLIVVGLPGQNGVFQCEMCSEEGFTDEELTQFSEFLSNLQIQ